MRILVIFIFVLLSCAMAFGQQIPHHSQYMFNDFLINPAVAGNKEYAPVILGFRNQWTGFTGAPRTMTLSMHTALDKKMGGPIIEASAYFMKSPPKQFTDAVALEKLKKFIEKNS